ncbi:MAG: CBS domain-containing protein [Planctomycetales bacterium]|nr:CBS domain-containing protein [Planctomycetales bacterium]
MATTPDAPTSDVMGLLTAQKQAAALVCDGSRLIGIFTERDALRLMAEGADLSAPISSVMTQVVASVTPGTSVAEAIKLMSEGGYRNLPVVDESGAPLGVVAVRGIVHYLVDHFPEAVYTQNPTGDGQAEREGA